MKIHAVPNFHVLSMLHQIKHHDATGLVAVAHPMVGRYPDDGLSVTMSQPINLIKDHFSMISGQLLINHYIKAIWGLFPYKNYHS